MKTVFAKIIPVRVWDQFLENCGLIRLGKHEEFKNQCEEFAKDYLESDSGMTIGGESGFVQGGTFHVAAVVIGSNVSMRSIHLEHGMAVAPWVRNLHAEHLISRKIPAKRHRAVVSLRCGETLKIDHGVKVGVMQDENQNIQP